VRVADQSRRIAGLVRAICTAFDGGIVINVKLCLAIGYEFEISQNFGLNTRLIQEIDLGWIHLSQDTRGKDSVGFL
jgi:hypothetical protein